MENMDYTNIPKEKLKFAAARDLSHDQKFATKPVGYFQGAFRRFCKNKGAIVGAFIIIFLVLFAIIGPFLTPYAVDYYDERFANIYPKNKLFENAGFWDGCKKTETNYLIYFEDYAIGLETGKSVIKGDVKISDDGEVYSYRYDTYYDAGFEYKELTTEEYEDIQAYQLETGKQVLYPLVYPSDRPNKEKYPQYYKNANYYYEYKIIKKKLYPKLDDDGNLVLNYWSYSTTGSCPKSAVPYNSTRIEGKNGAEADGKNVYYVYGRNLAGSTVEVRAEVYEYYCYEHYRAGDGITEPYFLFGTTTSGKDIFACLASGARFSFIFAIVVAIVNMFVGAIWGSIAGYFGGKVDLTMERITDVLGAIPTMVVITLLRFHLGRSMGTLSSAIILFITFFLTGWIGIAGTTRMQFYRYKNQEYVLAARTLGARDRRIMFKHIFPNAIGTLVTSCALIIPSMIYSETNLNYLGIINLEAGKITSVGTLIASGQNNILTTPYAAFIPCVFLVLLMLSFNLFGNGLRDAFNPSLRGSEE